MQPATQRSKVSVVPQPEAAKPAHPWLNRRTVLSFASMSTFLLGWQFLVSSGIVHKRLLAPPIVVIQTFITKFVDTTPDGATLQEHFITSLVLALIGFVSAIGIGTPLGLCMGWYRGIDAVAHPLFELMRPVPPIAWIPLSILWLGVGLVAKAFIIFVAAFVPCVINSHAGVKMTSPVLINVARTCGASSWQIFTRVCLPYAIPLVFAGFRISLGSAWSTLVAAELLAATCGLGYMIQMGRTMIRPDIIIVGMLTIGFTGAVMSWGLDRIERRLAPWRSKR